MFNKYQKRTFSLGGSTYKEERAKKKPLEDRVKMVSLSSFDSKRSKKRGYFLALVLFAVIMAMYYLGLPNNNLPKDKIKIKKIEKVNKIY